MNLKLKDVWTRGSPVLENIRTCMPTTSKEKIQQIQIFCSPEVKDTMFWFNSLDGKYTLKNGYH